MMDVILDTVIDGVKLLPFLFLTYLAMEYLEHRTSNKTKNMIRNSGKGGPLVGALLGAFPQCGFSTAASNLYAGRVITLGTLISVYLSTSDEMLPVFISEKVSIIFILKFIAVKIVIGMVMGFAIDFILRSFKNNHDITKKIGHVCENDHCHCDESILKSALRHTITIFAYIIVISFILNTIIYMIGEDTLGNIVLNKPIIGPVLASMVGLIPNCAASVVLTQLFLEGVMSFGAVMAGLLSGAGVGILVLFKENDNLKENIRIVAILYAIGALSGIIIDIVAMFI